MGRFCLILGSDVGRKRSSPFSDRIGLILSDFGDVVWDGVAFPRFRTGLVCFCLILGMWCGVTWVEAFFPVFGQDWPVSV